MESKSKKTSELPLKNVLVATSSLMRWRILNALFDTEGMTCSQLSKMLSLPVATTSKQLGVLKSCGVIEQRIGLAYSLRPQFKVPGERALEFGSVLIRLDRLDRK